MTPKPERAIVSLWRQRICAKEHLGVPRPSVGSGSITRPKTAARPSRLRRLGPAGNDPSRGASGKGVNLCPAMQRAASMRAELQCEPVASIGWVVRRRQPPCPPATSHAEAHPRLLMRQGAAAVRPRQPACGGSSTAFRPKRASSLGCHGRPAAARGAHDGGEMGLRRSAKE
jgi:hypothetical protein